MQTDPKHRFPALRSFTAELFADNSGLAMVEFAVSLPFFLGLAVAGLETANYAATNMRINQIAVHVADNAARMGDDVLAGGQQVSEIDINDVFTGARHEGNALVFDGFHPFTDPGTNQVISRGNARIFLSSIEPMANPNTGNKYRIRWQRCSGPGAHFRPLYGSPAVTTNVDGVGPTGRQTIAPPFGATMFAEIHYHFEPILDLGYSKLTSRNIVATAAMVVRDARDYSAVFNTEAVTASTCNFG